MAPITSLEEYQALFEHYKLFVGDTTNLSESRRRSHEIFIGLNTFVLSGFGLAFYYNISKTSWYVVGILVVIAAVAMQINFQWMQQARAYRSLISQRITYLTALERRMNELIALRPVVVDGQPHTLGMYSYELTVGSRLGGSIEYSRLEDLFIGMFLVIYPVITILVAGITALVLLRVLPPIHIS